MEGTGCKSDREGARGKAPEALNSSVTSQNLTVTDTVFQQAEAARENPLGNHWWDPRWSNPKPCTARSARGADLSKAGFVNRAVLVHPCCSQHKRLSIRGAMAMVTIPSHRVVPGNSLSWHTAILPLVHLHAGTEHWRAGVTVSIPSRELTWELSHFYHTDVPLQPDYISVTDVYFGLPQNRTGHSSVGNTDPSHKSYTA